jgi:hypothetical protein
VKGSIGFSANSGLSEIIEDLRRIGQAPSPETTAKLDAALAATFADTQARTHVLTGELKASGTASSEAYGDEWSGEITYGGPGVEQAIFEMALNDQVGEPSHDFLAGAQEYEHLFAEAMNSEMDL